MSGSPPLPPNPHREAVYRESRPFQASRQDAYGGESVVPGHPRGPLPAFGQLPPMQIGARPVSMHDRERRPSPYAHGDDSAAHQRPYSPQTYHARTENSYSGSATTSLAGPTFPGSAPQQGGSANSETTPRSSPKAQRKTKGHVASACVPCKRAHLRCDAQRPCSRCISNGKDDACVDVQHKKRGRPRLRDDREPRFDTSRYAHADDSASRRSSLYSPATSSGPSYEDALRRNQSYRVIKSQPSEAEIPDYHGIERHHMNSTFPHTTASSTGRDQDPVAFLTLDLTIANASEPFFEMLGSRDIIGRRLLEIVSAHERDRLAALQTSLQAEQNQREPKYLPPIFIREETDHVVRSLPLSADALSRFRLDRFETITFLTANGQLKPCLNRIGLAKEGSIYFVILRPELSTHRPHDTTQAFRPRNVPPAAQPVPRPPISPYSATREPVARQPLEVAHGHRQFENSSQGLSSLNQGPPSVHSSRTYAGLPASRIESVNTHPGLVPRSELPSHRPPPHEFQLPPIRMTPQPASQHAPAWQRDDRSGRVDIGRILDGPAPPRRE
ncbi:hypothetical protein Micbo1qcDRAFT_60062 [Microdochium bolleyi]|uniref:Zn(2)-C6 fungal-type domain-containing protein n=1 Tax=Microdochium bolleyi TaxID=196109 RepID=A0A136J4P0_9PEZI|nr:hypothetical protein Micbo1qcDRAFT_60062 [Microdochium bolleyi]